MSQNTFTKYNDEWAVKSDSELKGTVTVTRKNGTVSKVKVGSLLVQNEHGRVYEIEKDYCKKYMSLYSELLTAENFCHANHVMRDMKDHLNKCSDTHFYVDLKEYDI